MRLLSIICICFVLPAIAQDLPVKSKDLEQVEVKGKRKVFKQTGLYDEEISESPNIRGFNQLTIFSRAITDEFWCTKNTKCIHPSMHFDTQDTCLFVQWNKDQDGCDWVGMGFGWDMWSSKDMKYVLDTIALELEVRSTGKPFSNLPWAFGIEDYSGRQAGLGYNRSFLMSNEIGTAWTKVTIPFLYFPFEENDLDLTNVKQLIIQVFAEGSVEINQIKIVPFNGQIRKKISASKVSQSIQLDGVLNDWSAPFTVFGEQQQFSTTYTKDSLFLAFKIKDKTLFMNDKKDGELWNGDAIEIAFSTNGSADPKRKFFLLSDQHFGFNCGAKPYVWNWKSGSIENRINFALAKEAEGEYIAEVAIPFRQMFQLELTEELQLGFEVAIDLGDGVKRIEQQRWNKPTEEGFHLSPAKWGTIQFN